MGEVSNTYIYSSVAPERIAAFKPDMKLVTILRDPIDRAYSQYLFLLRNAQAHGSFRKVATSTYPGILAKGRYDVYLGRYLEHFDRAQIHVASFDHLKRDPYGFADQIVVFLGVDPSWTDFDPRKRVLPASAARSRFLARLVKRSAELVRSLGYPEIVTRVKASPVLSVLYKPIPKQAYPSIDPAYRRELCDHFRPSVERLSAMVGIDFTESWLRAEPSDPSPVQTLPLRSDTTRVDRAG